MPDMSKQLSVALIMFLSLLCTIPLAAATSTTFSVPESGLKNISVNLKQGNYVSGQVAFSLVPEQNMNGSVGFKVTDPNGNTVYKATVFLVVIFSFQAPVTGTYVFSFDNSVNPVSTKTLNLDYSVSSSAPNNGFSDSTTDNNSLAALDETLDIAIPFVIIIVGVVLYVWRYHNRYRQPSGTTLDPSPYVAQPANKALEAAGANNSDFVSEEDKKRGVLLSCKNAWLTETEFSYCRELGHISNMAEAYVNNLGLLTIRFNDGKTLDFRLAPDNAETESLGWRYLMQRDAALLEVSEKMKQKSKLWAAAINMLIAKKNNQEEIFCYNCGTMNKATEPKCLKCGATL